MAGRQYLAGTGVVTIMGSRAASFLSRHPELSAAVEQSSVWQRIKNEESILIRGQRMYVVGGDALGGEEELLLDRVARGATESGSDALSRQLFLDLPVDVQQLVWSHLLGRNNKG